MITHLNTRMSETSTCPVLSDPAQWVLLHGDALYRFALLRVRDAQVAEEVVQECFLAALQARAQFAGQCAERTWLIGILKHKILDHHRRLARTNTQPLDDDSRVDAMFDRHKHWASPPRKWDKQVQIENPVERDEFRDHFERCLKALPPQLATAFMLKVVDDADAQSVCKVLAITATNLWVILHRARLRLRKCLETHWLARTAESEES